MVDETTQQQMALQFHETTKAPIQGMKGDIVATKDIELALISNDNYTLNTGRMLNAMITICRPTVLETNTFQAPFKYFCFLAGIDSRNLAYIRKELRKLFAPLETVNIDPLDDDLGSSSSKSSYRAKALFPNIEVVNGVLTFEVNNSLRPLIANPERPIFPSHKYSATLSSKHGLVLYELLTDKVKALTKGIWSVETLRQIFRVQESKNYADWSKFQSKVLRPAVNDVNESTPFKIDFKPLKQGRLVTHVRFIVIAEPDENNDNQRPISDDCYMTLGSKFGFEDDTIKLITNKFASDYVERIVAAIEAEVGDDKQAGKKRIESEFSLSTLYTKSRKADLAKRAQEDTEDVETTDMIARRKAQLFEWFNVIPEKKKQKMTADFEATLTGNAQRLYQKHGLAVATTAGLWVSFLEKKLREAK